MKMRNRNKILFVFLLIWGGIANAASYDPTPVLLQVSKFNQPDSLGFSLVDQLTGMVYRKIALDQITLWDSPAKKLKISKVALNLMETQNNVSFLDNEDIFLYEFWKLNHHDFEFQIFGISFFRRLPNGEKVNFGYIDVEEALGVLTKEIIPTGSNGTAHLNFWTALNCKQYQFQVVKFGNKDLTSNPAKSFNLRDEVFSNPKMKTNALPLAQIKEIEFSIYPGFTPSDLNYWIFQSLDNYFSENRHEYFNLTSEPVISHFDMKTVLKVTKIETVEIWEKKDREIHYGSKLFRIYVNNQPLKDLTTDDLDKLGLLVQFKPLTEAIREKNYEFTLKRINDEIVPAYLNKPYQNALLHADWNKITRVAETEETDN